MLPGTGRSKIIKIVIGDTSVGGANWVRFGPIGTRSRGLIGRPGPCIPPDVYRGL